MIVRTKATVSINFTLETGKKPTPVCITSLTVELTPWDTDNDGVADTAAAEVWAYEFDRSSQAPCGYDDDDLEFAIEFLGDDNDSLDLAWRFRCIVSRL